MSGRGLLQIVRAQMVSKIDSQACAPPAIHLVSSKVFLLKVDAGYWSSEPPVHQRGSCPSPGPRGPERFSDLAQIQPALVPPSPSPWGCQDSVHSAVCSAPGSSHLPLASSALPAHSAQMDGQHPASRFSALVSPLPCLHLLLKFRWTNKPSGKAAEIPCIYPECTDYDSTAGWTGQNQTLLLYADLPGGLALAEGDWIVQWSQLRGAGSCDSARKKKVPSAPPTRFHLLILKDRVLKIPTTPKDNTRSSIGILGF